MVKTKHKNQSKTFHTSRTRIKPSHLSRAKLRDRRIFTTAKTVILTTIVLAILIVILVVLLTSFSNPERFIKHKIETIATNYYEDYFYPEIVTNNPASPSEIFTKYINTGFSRVTFRQLLLFDGERYAESTAAIATYCDLGNSYIQIFPESPFGKSDYHINYHYSCTFE